MGNSKTIVVPTSEGDVTVKKLALGDYAQVLRSLNQLPAKLADITKKDKSELTTEYILEILPGMLADGLPEIAGILAAATDKDADFILQLDLADVMDITAGALELNDVARIVQSIKKIQARSSSKPAPTTPSNS